MTTDASVPDGWLWRRAGDMRWHFTASLAKRTYPADTVFQAVTFVDAESPREGGPDA